MGKILHDTGSPRVTALVAFGWLSFVCSYVVSNPFVTMALQTVARVLPQTLVASQRKLEDEAIAQRWRSWYDEDNGRGDRKIR